MDIMQSKPGIPKFIQLLLFFNLNKHIHHQDIILQDIKCDQLIT